MNAIDDGRPFFDHAREAGYEPERWRESIKILEDLVGWIELHIEQARVLQDTNRRIGVVTAIAGVSWYDVLVEGRADHAGATPMDFRLDASVAAARCVVQLERLAREAGKGAVGTAGAFEVDPGLVNVIPGHVRVGMDIRAPSDETIAEVVLGLEAFVEGLARERGVTASVERRFQMAATPMDDRIVHALESAVERSGEPYMSMPSGAAHDTMCVADHVPTGMVFVPCKDGISHSPEESADPADAAVAAEVMLNAIAELT